MPSSSNIVGLLFRCPGVDGRGCPTQATTAFAIGVKPKDGLSLRRLQSILERDGWVLGAVRLPQGDGAVIGAVEPLCKDCGAALTARITGGDYQ